MKKKLISLLLALVVVIGLTAIGVAAEETTDTTESAVEETATGTEAAGHTDHCVCGGGRNGRGDHVCGEALTGWTEFSLDICEADSNTNRVILPAGNYYLSGDLTIGKELIIAPGTEVTFCLNGFELTGTRRVFRVNGVLNITDCYANGNGRVTGKASDAPVFYVYSGGHINLYGGILSSSVKDRAYGGVGALATDAGNAAARGSSSMTMYGGSIDASKLTVVKNAEGAHGNGGAVILMGATVDLDGDEVKETPYPATFIQYGGTIKGAKSVENYGGTIHGNGIDTIKILGGTVTAGTAAVGNGISKSSGTGQLVVGGNCNIEDLYLRAGQTFTTENLTGSVGLSAASAQVVSKSVDFASFDCFSAVSDTMQVTYESGNICLRSAEDYYFCRCGGNLDPVASEAVGHPKCDYVLFTPLTQADVEALTITEGDGLGGDSYTLTAGNYILTEDITISKALLIPASNLVRLNLNGHTLTATEAVGRAVVARGNLHLSDSAYDPADENAQWGKIVGATEASKGGQTLYVASTSTTFIYGGELAGGDAEATVGAPVATSGTLHMVGGKVTGFAKTTANGGAIALNDSGKINVWGGTVVGGEAKYGGAIYASSGKTQSISIRGSATVIGGSAQRGGNIYAGAAVSVNIIDGTVSNGVAYGASTGNVGGGGNIYALGNVTISGGTITGGTASRTQSSAQAYGGNIYLNSDATKTLTISNGTITGGTAVTGGNIFCRGKFTMSNGTVSNGTATGGMGGNLRLVATTTVNMTGGTVSNGHSSSQGGNLSLAENTKENVISNVKFSGGTCDTSSGGSVYISKCTNVTIENIEIDGGTSTAGSGGALYLAGVASDDDTLTEYVLTDCIIKNGSAKNNGGNIYADASAHVTLTNCTITDGSAKLGGNVYSIAKLSVDGGTISGGEATGEGGNIYAKNLTMTGGTVTGGTSASYGGNIYITGESTISGGTVEKGISTSTSRSGGNICVTGGELTISGDAVISGGVANEGGNMSVRQKGTINITGGTIENGEAQKHGGNISVYANLNVSGGLIQNGKAVTRGGNISGFANTCNINITGGEIKNGIVVGDGETAAADLYGANITVLSDDDNVPIYLTITGGTIGGLGEGCVEGITSVHVQSSGMEIITTVGGTAVIDELRLGTARMLTIAEGGFSEGASIGITRFELTGVFAPNAAADYSAYFHGTKEGTSVEAVATETGYDMVLVSSIPYWAFDADNNPVGPAKTIAEAMGLEGASFVRLVSDYTTDEVVEGDLHLDLYGYDLTGLTVNGNLYAVDYKGHDYEEGVLGKLISFTGTVQNVYTSDREVHSGVRTYVALANEDGSYSFHRVSVSITHISLDPANDALGYKATVSGDSAVLAAITGYGFNMGVEGGVTKTYTLDGAPTDGVFTLRLKGIMAANGGEMTIIGQPFVIFGEDTVTGSEKKTSMKETVEAVETAVEEDANAYTEAQMTAVQQLIAAYESYMTDWNIDAIKAWTVPTVEETPAA